MVRSAVALMVLICAFNWFDWPARTATAFISNSYIPIHRTLKDIDAGLKDTFTGLKDLDTGLQDLDTGHPAGSAVGGSGVIVTGDGYIVTSNHVIDGAKAIFVGLSSGKLKLVQAALAAEDKAKDLAILKVERVNLPKVAFREVPPPRVGEIVFTAGYPTSADSDIDSDLNSDPDTDSDLDSDLDSNPDSGSVFAFGKGTVKAPDSGLGAVSTQFQITAPVQPGNSGGPVLDQSGRLIGIIAARLIDFSGELSSELSGGRDRRDSGTTPQDINFAVKPDAIQTFLRASHIAYETDNSKKRLTEAKIRRLAAGFTVLVISFR